jgi:hypothetical protein
MEDYDKMNYIVNNIFSGNLTAATDKNVLEMHKINRILTVDSCPLPQSVSNLPGIKTLFIQGK